jgi:MFS transporter, CP family, cyanate transporter
VSTAARTLRQAAWVLPAAVVLVALNLRGPIVAPAPVIASIRSDLGLSATVAGLITTIPVLCFALATPFASWIIARTSPERAVIQSLVIVVLGTILRSTGSPWALLVGTAIIGIGITVGNVVIPVVIRRDTAPARVGMVTGIYTAALNVGSMLTSLATAPLAAVVGWPLAIAAWIVLAVVAWLAWWAAVGRRAYTSREPAGASTDAAASADARTRAREPLPVTGPIDQVLDPDAFRTPTTTRSPIRSGVVWGLMLAFGGQGFSYYALTAWIPTLLHDRIGFDASSAGASSSVFQIMAVVGALGVPVLATRWRPRTIIALIALCWLAMPLGLLFAPQLWLVWEIIGGAAQGGGITIIFVIVVRLVSNDDDARRTSALVQGGGYLLASAGPLVMGGLHGATGSWTPSLLVVLVAVLVLGVVGYVAARRIP